MVTSLDLFFFFFRFPQEILRRLVCLLLLASLFFGPPFSPPFLPLFNEDQYDFGFFYCFSLFSQNLFGCKKGSSAGTSRFLVLAFDHQSPAATSPESSTISFLS